MLWFFFGVGVWMFVCWWCCVWFGCFWVFENILGFLLFWSVKSGVYWVVVGCVIWVLKVRFYWFDGS